MKRMIRLVAVAVMAITIGGLGVVAAAPAEAAPPPKGYRTDQIMAEVQNPIYGTIPIRRGFFDADVNKGWGMDKAWHYHNIRTLNGQKILMGSNNATKQGNGNIDLKTYVGYYKCPNGSQVCTLKRQIIVHGIFAPNDANYILGWPVGGKVGLFNAYCDNPDRATKCPDWVTFSLNNPGKDNPYTSRVAPDGAPTPEPTSDASQSRSLQSAELADATFTYSYSELAETVPAAQVRK